MAVAREQTHIGRVRVKGAGLDPLLTPLRVEHLLNSVVMRPSGLPPSAILCVRELRDPMPGKLRLSGYSARLPQSWENALTASLDSAARNAARPLHQSVPTNADAVIFEDRAEMLACLALDWAKGTLVHHWWWRSLLRDFDVNRTVWSAWLETPHYAPPALAHLAARGEALMVVRRMDELMVSAILKAIVLAFRLDNIAQAIEESIGDSSASIAAASMSSNTEATRERRAYSANPYEQLEPSPLSPSSQMPLANVSAPWADRVPESLHDSLTMPRRLLLGVALSLTRDPVRVRTASFAWEALRWMQSEIAGIREISPESTQPPTHVPDVTNHDEITKDDDGFAVKRDVETHQSDSRAANEELQVERPLENLAETSLNAGSIRDDIPADIPALEASESPAPDSSIEPGTPIETAFGGLFYLLNLAVHLDLYGDYTSPRQHELELSIWDFVTLVGAELLGGTPPDPIWELLAQLAARAEDEPPGAHFSPPDTWWVNLRWLDAFPEQGTFVWSVADKRLRVEHPAAFPLVDIPLEGDLSAQLSEIRDFYGVDAMDETSFPTQPDDPLHRWLDCLIPYVRARLCRALGLEDADNPASLLCQHHARVFVTPAHVDVMLNLDTLPIAIRLAGLDRNPGWLAAAGRTVTFHFESNGG